jgi:putative hydrolase of the HAD superfamily
MYIIFDLFGVILSSGFHSSASALSRLFDRPISQIAPPYKKWEEPFDLGQIDSETFWRNVNRELGTDINWSRLESTVLESYVPLPGSFDLVDRFSKVASLLLLSNTRREWYESLDNKFSISERFERTYLSFEIGLIKPNPEIYRTVLSSLNANAEDVICTDDDNLNIRTASNLGIKSILYENAFETERHIQRYLKTAGPEYKKAYSGVLLISKDGSLILQRRENKKGISNPGKITTFGGIAKPGETPEENAIRELEEELGLLVSPSDLHSLTTLGKPETDNTWTNCTIYWSYGVDPINLRIREGSDIEFLSIDEAINHPSLSPVCRAIISRYKYYISHES